MEKALRKNESKKKRERKPAREQVNSPAQSTLFGRKLTSTSGYCCALFGLFKILFISGGKFGKEGVC
jgi:hypothetical protein